MIIVGSRCGGYNFYAEEENSNNLFWLGAEIDSDLDIYSNKHFPKSVFRIDFANTEDLFRKRLIRGHSIRYGITRPYFMDGKLHIPEDKKYLCIAIKKKLRKSGINYFEKIGKTYNIFDVYGVNVTKIKFEIIR